MVHPWGKPKSWKRMPTHFCSPTATSRCSDSSCRRRIPRRRRCPGHTLLNQLCKPDDGASRPAPAQKPVDISSSQHASRRSPERCRESAEGFSLYGRVSLFAREEGRARPQENMPDVSTKSLLSWIDMGRSTSRRTALTRGGRMPARSFPIGQRYRRTFSHSLDRGSFGWNTPEIVRCGELPCTARFASALIDRRSAEVLD